jgi:hypothetical protein
MSPIRLVFVVMLLASALVACGPGDGPGTPESRPQALPEDVSSQEFGDYVLYFNALTTDQLEPEVAQQYQIVRSKNRAMLNVSIVRKAQGTTGESVQGAVTATAKNLNAQLKNLTLREVQSGGAFYYIGDVAVADEETLIFDIQATPAGGDQALTVRFSRQFFAE